MMYILSNWIINFSIYSSILIFSSCGQIGNGNTEDIGNKFEPNAYSHIEMSDSFLLDKNVLSDTILVNTVDELVKNLRSNRVLKLSSRQYQLKTTLQIDGIKNLKLIGIGKTRPELMISEKNESVINLLNAQHIIMTNLIIGHSKNQEHLGKQGIIRIEHSSNIEINNCKIVGFGTFGLITYNVINLKFINSEITKCTALIFELEKSRKFKFIDSKFYDNHLWISVLGAFPNSTKEVTFTNCEFSNNKPAMTGNPAFNFDRNWSNFEEKIVFSNCTFENNKGYQWVGDKIELDNCKIDSTDFIGLIKKE